MEPYLVEETVLKYVGEDSNLYWEFRNQKENPAEEKGVYLNMQVPVPGMGVVHQSFPLDKETVKRIIEWLSAVETNM